MLVNDMLNEVRALSDENNTTDVSDADIISSLNRGMQKLVRIAVKRYEPMFLKETTITTFSGREATIPEAAYGITINQVDAYDGSGYHRVHQAPIRELTDLESIGPTPLPEYFTVRGNKIMLYPTPSSGTTLRVRYQVRPPKLVASQGRITSYDSNNNYIYVDDLGSELTTSLDHLKCFINVVDSTTGLVKGTLQISAINTAQKRLTIKTSSLSRATVFGNTVDDSLPTDIDYDDYVCIADGSCIPMLVSDYSDYLIQYSVVEILNRLGIPSQEATAKLKELENDIETIWAGRPKSIQVRQANRHWARRF